MIKHGFCPTCGSFTAAASYIDGVDNRVERLDFQTDEEIAQQVREAIAGQGAIALDKLSVTVLNGVVTLSGQVDSKELKRLTAELAYDVPSVIDVHNLLSIAGARAT
ncbi:periplasmic protein [compost metagenome]